MRVSVRKFQRHAWRYLGSLPLILTRYNKPVAKITFMFKKSPKYARNTRKNLKIR